MDNEIEITPQEKYFATDTEYELNEKGEIVETSARISLAKNIRFAIAINRKANGIDQSFDASTEWWSSLKQAIRIRDRLTHPKMPEDLDISGNAINLPSPPLTRQTQKIPTSKYLMARNTQKNCSTPCE